MTTTITKECIEFQKSTGRKEPDKTTYLPTQATHRDESRMTLWVKLRAQGMEV